MSEKEKESKIVSDEDWKQQAKREKEKLAQQQAAANAEQAGNGSAQASKTPPGQSQSDQTQPRPRGPLPAATFMTLVDSLMMQILFCLGKLSGKDTGAAHVDLELAKHHIDTLQLLEDKTKGNLTEEESKALRLALHECRMQYVQAAQL